MKGYYIAQIRDIDKEANGPIKKYTTKFRLFCEMGYDIQLINFEPCQKDNNRILGLSEIFTESLDE